MTVHDTPVERLDVRRDPDRDGAVDAWGHDALGDREGNGEGQAASEHLAEIALWMRRAHVCEKRGPLRWEDGTGDLRRCCRRRRTS